MAGVTVITTDGTRYQVPNGVQFSSDVAVTGELAVTVFRGEKDEHGDRVIASFGSVETVYLDDEVQDVTPDDEEPEPKKPFGL